MNNHFPLELHALNTWLKLLLQEKDNPIQSIFADIYYPWYLLSGPDQVLDLHGARIWVLFLAESILGLISCRRHTKIQHFADIYARLIIDWLRKYICSSHYRWVTQIYMLVPLKTGCAKYICSSHYRLVAPNIYARPIIDGWRQIYMFVPL